MNLTHLEELTKILAHLDRLSEVLPPRRAAPWPHVVGKWRTG
ncbi:MAG: hypothetical protein ACO2PN_18085 [Pyrobaculum sp.]|jgi:hypothetical protein